MSDERVVWEYRVETINTEYESSDDLKIKEYPTGEQILQSNLDSLGQEGWELIAFLPAQPEKDFRGNPKNPWVYYAIFKRPLTPV